MPNINIKRIYDPYQENDGYRILVDRLWPRGISKDKAQLFRWSKIVAPSHELRKLFHQNSERFDEFRLKYLEELQTNELINEELHFICRLCENHNVTLLYSAKNIEQNHATILKEELIRRLESSN